MLTSFKVEKLIISAIPSLVETWTKGFGFKPVDKDEKKTLNKVNLMVFPGTVLLKKTLYGDQKADAQSGSLFFDKNAFFFSIVQFSQNISLTSPMIHQQSWESTN